MMSDGDKAQLDNLVLNFRGPQIPATSAAPSQISRPPSNVNVALVLDWDDTLFPSTWIREDLGISCTLPLSSQLACDDPRGPYAAKLLECHIGKVVQLLDKALSLATVFIVTLAKPGWVELAVKNFAPALGPFIDRLEVVYAQNVIKDAKAAGSDAFDCEPNEQTAEFWTKVKEKAMVQKLMDGFIKDGVAWESLISVGDSYFEMDGAIMAGREYATSMHTIHPGGTEFSIKTFKLVHDPTIEELTAQLTMMDVWLPFLVAYEGDQDYDIEDTEDNAKLMELHRRITGEHIKLSWPELAGVAA